MGADGSWVMAGLGCPKRVLGGSWGLLGLIFRGVGRSLELLGGSCRLWVGLGAVLGGLGRSWGGLGAVLGGLGAVLGGLGAVLGRSWGGLGSTKH